MAEPETKALLDVRDLRITFRAHGRVTEAVKGISFDVGAGETIAVVGESGSGKSVTAMALTQLLPRPPVCQVSGSADYVGINLLALPPKEIRPYRGKDIAYIFQEPSSSLNPVFTVGFQIAEAIKLHLGVKDKAELGRRVVDALDRVGIRDAAARTRAYPHEMSGGMQQRVMIAMALACEPRILVADEPTTALDVTIQKQIIDLLRELRGRTDMSIILITHNFGIVAGFADRVLVMFRGEIVEAGTTAEILSRPQHPYTRALLECIPQLGKKVERLTTIDHAALGASGK